MPRFSIIVPVYNAALYLDDCLRSIGAQTIGDYEVVCVDDGSTDSSLKVLRAHALEDGRIHIVTQENQGPSAARNAGIRAATGDFAVFLDSDDELEPHALAHLAKAIDSNDVDVIAFGWSCLDGKPSRWIADHATVRDTLYPSFDPKLLFGESSQPFLRVAVRTSLLLDRGIVFDETLYLGEDAAFLFALYPQARGVKLISERLYRYRMPHSGSIMHGVSGDAVEECLQSVNAAISIYENWAKNDLLDHYGSDLVEWTVKTSIYSILRQDEPTRRELSALMRELWLAHFSENELHTLGIPHHAKRLVIRVLDHDAVGLSRDLLAYRLAEYGLTDLALTILEKIRCQK